MYLEVYAIDDAFHMIKNIICLDILSIPVSDLTFGDVIEHGNFAVVRKCVWNGTGVAVKGALKWKSLRNQTMRESAKRACCVLS